MTISAIEVSAEHAYEVRIGRELATLMTGASWIRDGRRALIVCNADSAHIAAEIGAALQAQSMLVHTAAVVRGEPAKSNASVEHLWQSCADAALDRSSVIVAVGGGTVTDVAGFVAATWMRGIDWVAVPTTTAGMVDAAIGGKTGINAAGGKNLVGAFHSPVCVLCATEVLRTLPRADYAAGLVEAVKCGFITDPEILRLCAGSGDELFNPNSECVHEIIRRAVQVKADVVSADFTEQGDGAHLSREILNYGHTFAHALEADSDYQMRHGDAVAIGMVFAAELSEALNLAEPGLAQAHRDALATLGVPMAHGHSNFDALVSLMGRDKKARAGVLRFILLKTVGQVTTADGVSLATLEQAFQRTRSAQ